MLSAQICRKRFSRDHVRRSSSHVDQSPDCEIRPTTGHDYTLVMLRYIENIDIVIESYRMGRLNVDM